MPIKIISNTGSVSKHEVYIDASYTEASVQELERLIKIGIIHPEKLNKAEICYNCLLGLPLDPRLLDHYPLQVTGAEEAVYIGSVSAGYGGEGPHGTIKCLKLLGFNLSSEDEDSILTKQKDENGNEIPEINLVFYK